MAQPDGEAFDGELLAGRIEGLSSIAKRGRSGAMSDAFAM
jgi:hypothetical protein